MGEWIAGALVLAGTFFVVVGCVGVVRLPDFYTRLHGAALTDTLGAGLVMFGLMVWSGWTLVSVKLFLILVFLWFTSPVAGYALAKAALRDKDQPLPLLGEKEQEVGH